MVLITTIKKQEYSIITMVVITAIHTKDPKK